MNRVRLSRGASTPGRGPRWTSSTGGRASRTSARRAAPMPSWRQRGEMPDHDQPASATASTSVVRVGEHRRGVDVDHALDGERRVGEQPARVAAAAARIGPRADETQRRAARGGEPRRRARAPPSRARRRRTGRRRRRRRRRLRPTSTRDVGGRALEQLGERRGAARRRDPAAASTSTRSASFARREPDDVGGRARRS